MRSTFDRTQAVSASRRITANPTVIIGVAEATQAAHIRAGYRAGAWGQRRPPQASDDDYQSVATYLVSV